MNTDLNLVGKTIPSVKTFRRKNGERIRVWYHPYDHYIVMAFLNTGSTSRIPKLSYAYMPQETRATP